MHVAYIHQHFSTKAGKSGTRSYEMAQRLIAAGHRVTMICGLYDATREVLRTAGRVTPQEVDGIDVRCIAEPYGNRMTFWERVRAFWRFANEATRVVETLDADLVFATSTPLTVGIPGMKGGRALRVPFVFEVRDLWPELPIALGELRNPLMKWYARGLERRIYAAASHIIALSPGMQKGIEEAGVPREKITMIPNGCDLDLFRPDPAPLTDPRFGDPSELRMVFSGAHGKANGLDAVLDAAAELKRRGEKGIRFVFIGDGRERARLIERSRTEGTDDRITWLESIPKKDLAAVLPRMDVGMMILKNVPQFYFGTSPNKFFDYIAAGIPVLNNYPGWLAGMIEKHQCGRVVPPDDPRAFADACVWFRDHRDDLEAMGARGRALGEAEFSRTVLGAQFVETLEAVHAGRRPARAGRPVEAAASA
jgi:glycosyltransferase involved in cell wall biosynthesis